MTSVRQASRTGSGLVGASFREIPAPSLDQARKIFHAHEAPGTGRNHALWQARASLFWRYRWPRAGWAWWWWAGSTPWPRWKRAGIPTQNKAMGTLMPFEELLPYPKVLNPYLRGA